MRVEMINERRVLTSGEVAAMFRVGPKTVTRWATQKLLNSFRTPGGHRRFYEDEVLEFRRSRETKNQSRPEPEPSA